MRMKQKTLTVNKINKNKECLKLSKSHAQWNQILSGAVCVIGFAIIFSFMLFFALKEHYEVNTRWNLEPDGKTIESEFQKCNIQRCSECNCKIKCENLQHFDNISYLVEAEYLKLDPTTCGKSIKQLILQIVSTTDHKLAENWLKSNLFKIKDLTISGSPIESIEPGAFKGQVFDELEVLTLNLLTIIEWRSNLLEGLSSLKSLNLWACRVKNIYINALKPVAGLLKVLQIQEMKDSWDPINITGTINLGSISIVDLRYNSFSVTLNSKTFTAISNCQSLFLDQCNIEDIGTGTFAVLPNLDRLNLKQNNLRTLNKDIFGMIKSDLVIYIDDNKWDCSCNMEWLKNMHESKNVFGDPTCSTPPEVANQNFSMVNFCEGSLTPMDNCTDNPNIMTTSLHPDTSLLPNENIIELFCTIQSPETNHSSDKKKILSIDSDDTLDEAEYVINEIPKPTVDFVINDDGSGTVHIEVSSVLLPNDLLIWFNKRVGLMDVLNKSHSIGCATRLGNHIEIENLNIGETYSFCFVQDIEKKISPLNCRAHIVEKPWRMQTWLSNEEKPLIISTVGTGLILCCILGAFIVYVMIRRNPSLLRGSKRVVMVKHNKTEAIVLPSKYTEPSEKKTNHFEMRSHRTSIKIPPFRRSVSEISIASARSMDASYISAAEPTTIQLLNWRLERLRNKMANETCINEAPITDLPPEVPERPKCSDIPMDFDSISSISEI